jgi:hypothetical protein
MKFSASIDKKNQKAININPINHHPSGALPMLSNIKTERKYPKLML